MKIGDKVRVVENHNNHGFEIGDVVECIFNGGVGSFKFSNDIKSFYMQPSEYERITPTTFQTGETYTTASGQKVKCIHIENGLAWCVSVFGDKTIGAAYTWDMDGVYQDAVERARGPYRIKFGPTVEVKYQYTTIEGHPVTIKYTTKDGVLDYGSITAEVAPF